MRGFLILSLIAMPMGALAGTPVTVTLDVQKMTCPVCPLTVRKALEKVSGVSEVKVDFGNKTATVTYDPDQAGPTALTKATTDAGYPSTVKP